MARGTSAPYTTAPMATLALDVRVSTPGGGKTYIESLIPELCRQTRHRVVLVRTEKDGLSLPDTETLQAPGPRVAQVVWSQTTLAAQLRARGVDLYHSLKHPGPLVYGGRTICTLSAAGPYDGLCLYPLPVQELLYWNVLGRHYLRRADHVIAVSRFVARSLPPELNPPPDRLDVIPHGLPEPFRVAPLAKRPERGSVLAVGNVVPVKNFSTLVRAYAALPDGLREAHPLVIAGTADGSEGDLVRATAQSHGVRPRFAGYLDPDGLLREFAAASVFVVSSLQESFSLALLEAMSAGLPCVVTDCGGATEVGGDAVALIRDPRDVRGLRDAVQRLLLDGAERQRLSALARARALTYSWPRTAERTLEVYDRVLARPARERA
jgi:glycosyltransferase involved in cell wall biosynthesis